MTYYYGVAYFRNGEANISMPFESYEEMIEEMKKAVARHPEKIKATSYITRSEKMDTIKMFGCPKTRNLMLDKKFVSTL